MSGKVRVMNAEEFRAAVRRVLGNGEKLTVRKICERVGDPFYDSGSGYWHIRQMRDFGELIWQYRPGTNSLEYYLTPDTLKFVPQVSNKKSVAVKKAKPRAKVAYPKQTVTDFLNEQLPKKPVQVKTEGFEELFGLPRTDSRLLPPSEVSITVEKSYTIQLGQMKASLTQQQLDALRTALNTLS